MIQRLRAEGLMLAEIARTLGANGEPVQAPQAVWSYAIAEDVTVLVRADAAPWRLKKIQSAIAEMSERLQLETTEGERNDE